MHQRALSDEERDTRVVKALRDVGLDPETRFRYPHEFSGGQRQRISIARAVVLEPNFVVLDEPTSALDMLFQAQMVDLLRELQRKRDLTYMFISHDLRVVASLASHLIVMRHGKVVEEGPAAELFKNPEERLHPRAVRRRVQSRSSRPAWSRSSRGRAGLATFERRLSARRGRAPAAACAAALPPVAGLLPPCAAPVTKLPAI